MNCDDCRELVLDLLYAEISPAQKLELEAHLASCPACAREYQELGKILSAVRGLPDPEVPRALDARVIVKAREAARKSPRPRASWSRLMRPAMAMAALVVITASVAIIMHERGALVPGAAPRVMAEGGKPKAGKQGNATGSAPLASLGYLKKDQERYRELPEAAPAEAQPEAPSAPAQAITPAPAEAAPPPEVTTPVPASLPPAQAAPGQEAVANEQEGEVKTLEESAPEAGVTAPPKPLDLDALALSELQKKAEAPAKAASPAAANAGMSAGAAAAPAAPTTSSREPAVEKPAFRAASAPRPAASGPEAVNKEQAAPDPKALLREAHKLEAQKDYRQALARYEQALALLGYNPAAPARRDEKASAVCSPELKDALDGAARLYLRLLKLGDLRNLENWRQAHCP